MTAGPMDKSAATPSWRVSLAMTFAAWMAAFAIVTALPSIFSHQLAALPLAVRALVISGVVVIAMTRLVQPALNAAAHRWAAAPRRQDSNAPHTDAALTQPTRRQGPRRRRSP
jgi:antibiotic biosynthesis monooxygenase (ABM) superfamily enzyme